MIELRIVVASTRPVRLGPTIADWVRNQAPLDVFAVEVIDLAELNLPLLDEVEMPSTGIYHHEHTLRWKGLVDGADAIVLVTPEYNAGYPAALKNAIDYLYAEWEGKPIAFVGYGFGGGGRATKALTQLMENLKADVVGTTGLIFNTDVTMEGRVTAGADKLAELHSLSDKLADAAAFDDAAA